MRPARLAAALTLVVAALTGSVVPAAADTDSWQTTTATGTGDPAGTVTAAGAWGLVEAGGNLGDVDVLTGDLLAAGRDGTDALAVADLFDAGQLALDAQQLADQARAEGERRRAEAEARQRAAALARTRLPGVPASLQAAIDGAVADIAVSRPACRIDAAFLAAVARNESGSWWDRIGDDGVMAPPLRSPDGAMGPFQFMPSAWSSWGADGNGDGTADADNAYDAAIASARMHCDIAADRLASQDLTNPDVAWSAFYLYCAGPNADPGGRTGDGACATSSRSRRDDAARFRDTVTTGAGQTTIGPDGCPTSAPSGTLRGGAATIGVHQLCVDSVAQAPTPQAAQAIKWALAQLGVPYSQPKRNQEGFFDCSSLVTRSYQAVGVPIAPPGKNAPTTHSMLPRAGWSKVAWSVPVERSSARPGDLLFPHEGHVTMLLANGYVIHAPASGDVVHIRSGYGDVLAYRRVDPTRA